MYTYKNTIRKASIQTGLLCSSFVADGRLEMHGRSTRTRGMTTAADQNSKTRLFEYGSVVVVGIPHCPATHVSSRLTARLVRSQTVAVRQHIEHVMFTCLQLTSYNNVYTIPTSP